jgi:mannose-6-phosphate isomerase-like protein (cupin superfamily)
VKYVFSTESLKRYSFPTHINDLIVDRSESSTSEVFVVIVEPGKATHMHKHDDTEQVFYVLSGQGVLEVGEQAEQHEMKPGDVVRIPISTYHRISCLGQGELRYLAVDCFLSGRPKDEPTWDAHVHVVCQQQGWDYDEIVKEKGAP